LANIEASEALQPAAWGAVKPALSGGGSGADNADALENAKLMAKRRCVSIKVAKNADEHGALLADGYENTLFVETFNDACTAGPLFPQLCIVAKVRYRMLGDVFKSHNLITNDTLCTSYSLPRRVSKWLLIFASKL